MRETICVAIKQKETGRKIRKLMVEHGYSVRDIQEMMGFESQRAVYKWLAGDSLPTVDNLLILSRLHTNMENILVYDGDFSVYRLKKERHNFVMAGNTIFPITILESRSILRKWLESLTHDWHQTETFLLEAMDLEGEKNKLQ